MSMEMQPAGVCPSCGFSPMSIGRLGIRYCMMCEQAREAAEALLSAASAPTQLPEPEATSAVAFKRWQDALFRKFGWIE